MLYKLGWVFKVNKDKIISNPDILQEIQLFPSTFLQLSKNLVPSIKSVHIAPTSIFRYENHVSSVVEMNRLKSFRYLSHYSFEDDFLFFRSFAVFEKVRIDEFVDLNDLNDFLFFLIVRVFIFVLLCETNSNYSAMYIFSNQRKEPYILPRRTNHRQKGRSICFILDIFRLHLSAIELADCDFPILMVFGPARHFLRVHEASDYILVVLTVELHLEFLKSLLYPFRGHGWGYEQG